LNVGVIQNCVTHFSCDDVELLSRTCCWDTFTRRRPSAAKHYR